MEKHTKEGDSFIGLDIEIDFDRKKNNLDQSNNGDRAGTPHSHLLSKREHSKCIDDVAKRSQKRQRQTSTKTATLPSHSAKKPRPPPAPPSSLVALLRKDQSVLSYFKSLQENLEYDVEKWKREAKRWKQLAKSSAGPKKNGAASTEKMSNNGYGSTKSNDLLASKQKKTESTPLKQCCSDRVGKDINALSAGANGVKKSLAALKEEDLEHGSTISITDEALFGDIENGSKSSKSGSDKCSTADDLLKEDEPIFFLPECEAHAVNHYQACKNNRQSLIYKLKEAKQILDELGISLVEVEVSTSTSSNETGEAADEENFSMLVAKDDVNVGKNNSHMPETPLPYKNDHRIGAERLRDSKGSRHNEEQMVKTFHRQPDEKVASEMMASLRTSIKSSSYIGLLSGIDNAIVSNNEISLEDQNCDEDEGLQTFAEDREMDHGDCDHIARMRRWYHPFCKDGNIHVPNIYLPAKSHSEESKKSETVEESLPPHPASKALSHLIHVLFIMDTFCRDDVEDFEWDSIFNYTLQTSDKRSQILVDEEILRIGMRNRARVASRILSSLDVEISRIWALTEMASNIATPTLYFHPADVMDPVDESAGNNASLKSGYGAKSYNRLVNLEERIAHARIATILYRRRGDWQKALELVIGYIISSAPSIGVSPFPQLPPVLSLCILEALIVPENYAPMVIKEVNVSSICEGDGNIKEESTIETNKSNCWFVQQLRILFAINPCRSTEKSIDLLLQSLSYATHVAAGIWVERSRCSDDRIRDAAMVELAAYKRIQTLSDGVWLRGPGFHGMSGETTLQIGQEILSSALTHFFSDETSVKRMECTGKLGNMKTASTLCSILSLLTLGEINEVIQVCNKVLCDIESGTKDSEIDLSSLPICCLVHTRLMNHHWDSIKLADSMSRHTAVAFTVGDKLSPILRSIEGHICPNDWDNVLTLIQSYVILSDGRNLLRLAVKVIPSVVKAIEIERNNSMTTKEHYLISRVLSLLIDTGGIATVRVINLKRRPDRLIDFTSHCHKEQLIFVKGPTKLRHKSQILAQMDQTYTCLLSQDDIESCIGDYAFDGQCSSVELERQAFFCQGRECSLSDFVSPKWRPSELSAFDNESRKDFELVQISNTERACALSHISSWVNIEKSLRGLKPEQNDYDTMAWYQQKLIGMLKISGFARGKALLPGNEDMSPVPVCVVLEDDAVLGDRFSERLDCLLEELPRDFHFCSLGYSRPKSAPMVEYSSQLGIPSCLWYLTGYVLSLDGARHLIRCLPVSGPVDSWIGLKMCSNWDNIYGHRIGVGKHSMAQKKLPPRKDLAKILKFRALAALNPLCAQKVGTISAAATRVGWRERDTDITYSG